MKELQKKADECKLITVQ